jgi:proteasome lid subunit RPN8/RPN11
MINVTEQVKNAIRAEGEKAYPNECCGVLLGAILEDGVRSVENILPIHNAREKEEQYHRFRIEPEELMRAEKEARARSQETLGFYHSHPDHPARPSEYDRNKAFPFYSYIIVSVEKSKAGELKSWRLSEDRKEFLEEFVQEEEIWQ